jgi:hypothetical protein
MNDVAKCFTFIALGLFSLAAIAAPKQLITHNSTDLESNAFVAGSIPSQHPTKAHSDGKVFWTAVKLACFGHTVNGQCAALIKMATNTANPIEIGTLQVDVNSGEITPHQLSTNGFTITVNGPGETTISKNP